ncbi:MAG TPA: glycogen/starch/alpha-glucan phosphorylase [Burkholderiaceae bacterium]|nr:glycogen/starch/alpha-glucan phosphorylase [Burkholderiaceae bacterium]
MPTSSKTVPRLPRRAPTLNAAQRMTAFRAAVQRELAQRSDGPTPEALLWAVAHASRELLAERWVRTQAEDRANTSARRVHYLSMEFLMGRALGNAVAALGLDEALREAVAATGVALPDVLEREADAALGNGGLGRLAACFLDSFATLGLPSFGYGVRYQYGMFAQQIANGRQLEAPDDWLRRGNPWEILRPELHWFVGFGGRVQADGTGRVWLPAERVLATAYDFIVPGHGTERVATLRQWHASSEHPIDFAAFCRGEHLASGRERLAADMLNWVLYPDDSTPAGREMRLKQEFLLVSASLQDMLARHLAEGRALHDFGRQNSVHLNDTHPALVPAELMRLLIDEHGLEWDEAWHIVHQAVSYTNHTLMPEALETWAVPLFEALLPRHMEIVYEINRRFLEEIRARFPGDEDIVRRLSLIDEGADHGQRRVRMASLSVLASHKVNGVSALHSKLCVETIFADFAKLYPDRFTNITNGVTPRRWLMQANPALATLIDAQIGPDWRVDASALTALARHAHKKTVQGAFMKAKRANKGRLAALVRRELGVVIDPASLFDVHIKRIHEYKRQLLNLLQVVARYQAIVEHPHAHWVPRTVIFAGKAASAYLTAKTIVHLIHDVARVVNSDPRVGAKLRVVFLPNYSVSLAEVILPAADLSEQISTAGTEASGTGNMKFALNGALTIGTWDGANIEMAGAVGRQHFFIFGLDAQQVSQVRALGYDPRLHYQENATLRRVIDAIAHGAFSPGEPDRYRALVDSLLHRDAYLLFADFAPYLEAQDRADRLYLAPKEWAHKAILNIAGMGAFSADRTIREYARGVWNLPV